MIKFIRDLSVLVLLVFCVSACSTSHFLWQAGRGQLAMVNRAKPIQEVIKDPRTSPKLARLLGEVEGIKSFGETQGLKATQNYVEYVSLDRPVAVWVVSASEALRFKSKEWYFPIVGSMPYLGWFDKEEGQTFASELKKEGWDVDLRGAAAFSTLGWFRDAVLSSMIPSGDEALGELVNVVLHESVHATYYLNSQAYFNESLASFVGDQLTWSYLKSRYGESSTEWKAYLHVEQEQERRQKRMHEAYLELEKLYSESATERDQLLERKRSILERLSQDLKATRELNNATLIQFKTYNTGRAEFEKILSHCHSEWKCFWKKIHQVTEKSFKEKQQVDLAEVLSPLL